MVTRAAAAHGLLHHPMPQPRRAIHRAQAEGITRPVNNTRTTCTAEPLAVTSGVLCVQPVRSESMKDPTGSMWDTLVQVCTNEIKEAFLQPLLT